MVNIKEQEEKILDFWEKNRIFEKSLEKTKNEKPYIFYDGPPFATGTPHYGHLLGSIIKDIYGRFWTMNNRYVRRVWGWDCHGLPIENIAEKDLGINSKDEIEKLGIKKFNNHCRSKVLSFADEWKKVIKRLGRWVDMDSAYKTMDNSYIESVWFAFKQLWEKRYIYQGEKILMYCPRCSTPLAKAEIAMDNSYRKIKEDTIVVKFKLKNENVYALAWTTTPWTLPSNLALTVNPSLIYVYVRDKKDNHTYLLAKSLIGNFYKIPSDYEILKEVKGKSLENIEFEPLFNYFKDTPNAFKILLGDFVTAEDGTGIVHTAPAFGEDDYNVCTKYNIPLVQPVDEKGLFTKEVPDFKGKFIHNTNKEIIDFLKKQGKIVLIKKVEHEYPFCYRCETKLLYRAIPAWFVNIQKIKPRLLELSKKINWYPEFLKEGRVKYTIETAPDWNISRNRYWATAIPIWESKEGDKIVIGSIEELKKLAKNMPKEEIDLHKDYLDNIILEKNGKEYKRIPEVLDCWFESGSMTFAQFHYPFENKVLFKESFPSQFVAEYIAQVRTWFYYMMVLSAILFDDIPFENFVTTGNILAEDGQKMSKSKNNFTNPLILIDKFGVDALRFYLAGNPVMNAQDINFSDSLVEEIYKKVMILLYNVNNFYNVYPEIKVKKAVSSHIMDKWIISRLTEVSKNVSQYLKEYNTIKSCSEIKLFIEDLSTWFVRRSRDRFNEGDVNAKSTLKKVLEELSIIIAPLTPFVAEIIFQTVNPEKSVHLEQWKKPEEKLIDLSLNKNMEEVRKIVSEILKIRDKNSIGLKWPLKSATISFNKKFEDEFLKIIKDETNVKDLIFLNSEKLEISLDTELTPELEAEGYSRELVRNIQAERKKLGKVKTDVIKIKIPVSAKLKSYLENNIEFIKSRINSSEFDFVDEKNLKNPTEAKIKSEIVKFSFQN